MEARIGKGKAYIGDRVESASGWGEPSTTGGLIFRGRPRPLFTTGASGVNPAKGGTSWPAATLERLWMRANSSIEVMALSRHFSSDLNSPMIFSKSIFAPKGFKKPPICNRESFEVKSEISLTYLK